MKKLIVFCSILVAVSVSSVASNAYGATEKIRQAPEYHLKAAYLYRFLSLAEWPKSVSAKNDGDTICIGILGNDPFDNFFDSVEGRIVKGLGKKLVIKRYGAYREGIDLSKCQVLFISSSEKRNVKCILSQLKKVPVLTISDMAGYIESGGMMNLVMVGRKIRLEINSTPIKLAGLKLSSKLLDNAVRTVD